MTTRPSNHATILLVYSLLTILFTYPLAFRIGSALPGIEPDTYLYIWDLEWVRRAIFEFGTNPFFTREIYYPSGISLYFHSLILGSDVLALPLQFAVGAPAAYMLMTLAAFVLSGYATYLLAVELTRNWRAAFFAGLAFAFAPYHLAHLTYSHFDLMPLQWLPLFALAAKKLYDRISWVHFLLGLVFLVWASLTDWYYALYAVLFFGIYTLYRAYSARSGRVLVIATALGLAYVVVLSPLLIPMLNETSAYPLSFRGVAEADKFSADLLSFVTPSTYHPLWGATVATLAARFGGGPAERTLFLGYTTLCLTLIAIVSRKVLMRDFFFWLLLSSIFLVIALGPTLHIGGIATGVPLPYALTFQIPLVSNVFAVARSISRFGIMVMLGASILAAFGLQALMTRITRLAPTAWLVVACILVGIEFLVTPLATTRADAPASMKMLAATRETFAVLDVPIEFKTGGEAMYFSTITRKPTMNGYHSRLLPFPAINGIGSMRGLLGLPDPSDIVVKPQPTAAQVLNFFDVRYSALHKQAADDHTVRIAARWINNTFGKLTPLADDRRITLYQTPSAPIPPLVVSFAQGWYEPEKFSDGTMWRWMQNDGRVVMYARDAQRVMVQIDATSLASVRHLEIFFEEKQVYRGNIPTGDVAPIVIPNLALHAGANELRLHSVEAAQQPYALGLNDDYRFFTLAFSQLSLAPP